MIKEKFPIVGIGASAVGLTAIESLFSNMPSDTGMAFILLLQYQKPEDKSSLDDLIKEYTEMQVYQVEEEMVVEQNCIYIIPPNRDINFQQHGLLSANEPTGSQGGKQLLPIDFFFCSLAQAYQELAICILLSADGADGTLGLKAIKEQGGLVMVQDYTTAEYEGMPSSPISTGQVDYMIPPEEMGAQLKSYFQYVFDKPSILLKTNATTEEDWLAKIFTLLYIQTGHDFSFYKKNTINRRIRRRLAVNQIEYLEDYFLYLEQNSSEVEVLFREFLIGVTNFFRDKEAFDILEEKIIPRIFSSKTPGEIIRIWVPGCSTGEEAYSIAILFREYIEATRQIFNVRIFASDIDSKAIEQARMGIYPANIAKSIAPERLSKFFIPVMEGKAYRIQKTIRDMIVFGEQSVISDPPFSRLDMVSCRNLLIYIDVELQKRVMHLFHYALNQNGFLFLGSSETTGDFMDLFTVVDRKWKFYQSKSSALKRQVKKSLTWPLKKNVTVPQPLNDEQKESKDGIKELVESALLKQYAPACVVISKSGEILYIYGRTGKYLELLPGEARMNILQMAHEGLRFELKSGISKAVTQKKAIQYQGLQVVEDDKQTIINLSINPITEGPLGMQGLIMVIFEEVSLPQGDECISEVAASSEASIKRDQRHLQLEQELLNKEEYLQIIFEELESSNEELQSANEEHQTINEELETAKEELQAVNEELITVNVEMQKNIQELSQANNDINNMLSGTGVGTIFVDCQLRIKRFTAIATKAINLIQNDIGRPISHIVSNLVDYDCLTQDVQTVMKTLVLKEVKVQTGEGLCYLLRILPYRTLKNEIEGAVITFIDITEQK